MVNGIDTCEVRALLLAGGQSSRMGTDKALLARQHKQPNNVQQHSSSQQQQHNQTQLSYMLELLSQLGLKEVLLSRNPHQQDDQHHNPALARVSDNFDNGGPLAGIEAAMAYCLQQSEPGKALLVVPVDLPLLTERTLRYLLSQGQARNQACYFRNHFLPLFLPLSPLHHQLIAKRLMLASAGEKHQGLSIKNLCQQIEANALVAPHSQSLINTNTPQQWQQAGFCLRPSLYLADKAS